MTTDQIQPTSPFCKQSFIRAQSDSFIDIPYGCFHTTIAESSSCDRPTKPKIITIWPFYRKSVPTPVLSHREPSYDRESRKHTPSSPGQLGGKEREELRHVCVSLCPWEWILQGVCSKTNQMKGNLGSPKVEAGQGSKPRRRPVSRPHWHGRAQYHRTASKVLPG